MMRRLIAVLVAVMTVCGMAVADNAEVPELKRAILMTYYGTSDDSIRAISIDTMTRRVKESFPDIEVREAYTSRAAANALRRRTGIHKPLFVQAMRQLEADGYNSVTVCCGELIEGQAARIIEREVEELRPLFFEIKTTTPLFYSVEDCRQALRPIIAAVGAKEDEQVVLVGHGRDGAYNDVYCLIDYILQHEGHANFHVGTISGYPTFENVRQTLRLTGTGKVVLVPLIMIQAGHATKDIYKTWREALEADGSSVRVVRKGVREYEDIQQLIIDKLRTAIP